MLSWLRRSLINTDTRVRPRKARLQLASLEERDVPAALAFLPESVRDVLPTVPSVVSEPTPTMDAAKPTFVGPIAQAGPATLDEPEEAVEDAASEKMAVGVTGVSPTAFNPVGAAVTFTIKNGRFSGLIEDVQVTRNGATLALTDAVATTKTITIPNVLLEGQNNLRLKTYDSRGLPVYHSVTLWAGSRELVVTLVDEAGKPIKKGKVTLLLGDDQRVSATLPLPPKGATSGSDGGRVRWDATPTTAAAAATGPGVYVFKNVPDRTLFLEGKAGKLLGFVGVTGNIGAHTLTLNALKPLPAPPAAALVAPEAATPETPVISYTLATTGQGEQKNPYVFKTHAGTTSVRIRYRFTTSEVPGGYFGTKYNDYFRVTMRTASKTVYEQQSMNGLGLAAFSSSGATQWREKTIKVNPKGENIEVEGVVANVADGLFDSYIEVEVTEAKADLAYKLNWDVVKGGLKITWTAKAKIEEATPVGLYFATGTNFDSRIEPTRFDFIVPAGTKAGTSKTVQVAGNLLYNAPANATHVLVASSELDAQAIADVQLGYGAQADSSVVTQRTLDVLKNSLRAAGQAKATITSTLRSPADQARAMFNNLVNPKYTIAQNIAEQHGLYGAPGDAVIDVFAALTAGQPLSQIKFNAAFIQGEMAAKIVELWGQGKIVSNHCVTPADYAAKNVVDVGRSVFTATARGRFIAAANGQAGVPKVIDEPKNSCVHLEISQ